MNGNHDHLILAIAAALSVLSLALGYIAWEVRRAELEADAKLETEITDTLALILDQMEANLARLEATLIEEPLADWEIAYFAGEELRAELEDDAAIAAWLEAGR